MAEVKGPTLLASAPGMHSLQKLPGGSVLEVMAPSFGAARLRHAARLLERTAGWARQDVLAVRLVENLRRWR